MSSERRPRHADPAYWRRREWVYPVVGPVLDAVARLLFRLDVRGLERIPRRGPALVMANHVSQLDPLVLLSVLRRRARRPRYVALEDLWEVRGVGWLLEHGRMIPVRRGMGTGHMVEAACTALQAGQAIVVYPEGTVVHPHERPPARAGAGLLARRAPCPVLPIAMSGVPPYDGGLPALRQPATVRVGEPLDVRGPADATVPEVRRAGEAILDAVRGLR